MDPLQNSHTAPKFAATNPGNLASWYVAHLGFPHHAIFENGDYAIVRRGDLTLHFWKCTNAEIAKNTSCYVHISHIEALNQLHSELSTNASKAGFAPGKIQEEPEDAPGHGMREFHVWDPDGNLLAFGAELVVEGPKI